jgi:predicted DNA-binding protein YlxM (UPF0122 family)
MEFALESYKNKLELLSKEELKREIKKMKKHG